MITRMMVQLIKLDRLAYSIEVQADDDLNQLGSIKPNDVVLVGCPGNDLVQVGIVSQNLAPAKQLLENAPTIVSRIEWPSKALRGLVAKFKIDQLMGANYDG